jgi:hypothetical protein
MLRMFWTCYEYLGKCNMSLGMLCILWNTHKLRGYECKTCRGITQFFSENMNELLYFHSVQVEKLFFIANFSTRFIKVHRL